MLARNIGRDLFVYIKKANGGVIYLTEEDNDENNVLKYECIEYAIEKTNIKDTTEKCGKESGNDVGKMASVVGIYHETPGFAARNTLVSWDFDIYIIEHFPATFRES